MCFDNAFFDGSGRMWLTPCIGTQTGLHLFQFDGYEFRAVRGNLDKLPTDTKFLLMDAKERLVGFVNDPGKQQVVYYDPRTEELQTYALPPSGEAGINRLFTDYKLFTDENGVLNLHVKSENDLLYYKLKGEELVLIHKIDMEYSNALNLIRVFGEMENEIWSFSPGFDKLYRIDDKTGERKVYEMNGVEFLMDHKATDRPFIGKLYKFDNNSYLTLFSLNENRSVVLKQEEEGSQFSLIKGLPFNAKDIQVFGDDRGNSVFLFRFFNNEYKAILETQQGKRYDYSGFFNSSTALGKNVFLKSPDFKKQLLVCHSQGILLQTVKVTEAITPVLPKISIRAMVELPGQKTLITTQKPFERFIYNNRTGQMEVWENLACNMTWAKLLKDRDGFIWGIEDHGFIKFDPSKNTCEKYPASITKNVMTFVGDDRIAFVQEDQLAFFDLTKKKVVTFNINGEPLKIPGFVHDMLYSRKDILWIATTKGLMKVDPELQTSEIIGLKEPFLDFRFLCIYEDEKGLLWLGTPLGGIHIYNPVTGELKIMNSENGLSNNTVATISADNDGFLWAGTYNGISIISPDGELIANLYEEDGLIDREANRFASLKTSDGKLLIGTVSGLNIIDPQKVKEQLSGNKDLKIYMTAVSYFDGAHGGLVSKRYGLNDIGILTLPADRRNLQVKFAVSNYFKPEFNQYAYQLEGISDDWIPIGNQNSLNLNNMPAGHYRLLIRGSDGTGNWTEEPLAIRIHARDYYYKQTWFYLLSMVMVGGLTLLWVYRLRSEVRKATMTIREDKEIIERQAEKLLELDQAKSRFFTNISHEFRTPLTIISGMIDQINEKPDLWLARGTKMIKQNTAGLLNLVNQLLDLRKLESNELKVEMVNGDVVKYMRYISESHQSYAEHKGLQLHFLPNEEKINMDYDPDKLLRIISNLLSNAIKFTPEGGNIYFHIDKITIDESPLLSLKVQDTGAGIPEEDQPHIFGRFYQAGHSSSRKGEGTGIGLALTRELVKILGGNISVKSTVGKGTTFSIELPITNESASPATDTSGMQEAMSSVEKAIIEPALINPDQMEPATEYGTAGKPSLLIVEDNPDVQQYLVACLENDYQLTTAENGRIGIEMAIEQVPDLIVSDVMMPEKDGYQLTEYLKNDERTDHIPIVLLTAKADLDSRISGLEKGADAYLSKPFEKKELLIRLEKLLELRQKLQVRYAQVSGTDKQEETTAIPENPFLQKFYALVEKELSNPDLDMNQLCRNLGMSRSQVFRKLKALTGQPATILIRSFRLQQGKKLLATSDLTISEVAYEVGFTSLNYFSNAFFEEFGERPSATRK